MKAFAGKLGIVLLLLLAQRPLLAKVYYVNKGVLYHIGDARFARSSDPTFLGAYPVVGQEWVQAFTVDRADKVKVRIEVVRGVDDCPYCKDLVAIDDTLMGRLYQENNSKAFDTPEPLAKSVEPGRTYYLKISSVGLEADDFAIANVVVETDKAELTLLQPGPILKAPDQPLPRLQPPPPPARPSSPCEGLPLTREWMPGWKDGLPIPLQAGEPQAFKASPPVAGLKAGQALDLDLSISHPAAKDAVSQVLECLVGSGEPSGWVFLFSAEGALRHGNLLIQGDYSAEPLRTGAYRPGQVNRLHLERCTNGTLRAFLNGVDLGQSLDRPEEVVLVSFRAQGLQAELKSPPAGKPN